MEWTEIIVALLSGTTVASIVEAIRFRKQNKAMKDSEAKQAESGAEQSDIETQKQKIDLGNKFMQESLAMMETIKQYQESGNRDTKEMMADIKELKMQNKKQDGLLTDIVNYLNGDFQKYLKKIHKHK